MILYMTSVIFNADKISLRGPSVDGSWKVTFETGEYEKEHLAELMKLPTDVPLKITVEINESK